MHQRWRPGTITAPYIWQMCYPLLKSNSVFEAFPSSFYKERSVFTEERGTLFNRLQVLIDYFYFTSCNSLLALSLAPGPPLATSLLLTERKLNAELQWPAGAWS